MGFRLPGVALNLSQGLQAPGGQPKEVRQGTGAPRGSSQGPNSQLHGSSPSSRGLVPASTTSLKSFLRRKINIKSSSIVCFLFIGIDLREGNYWAYSHLKRHCFYLSSPREGETLAKEASRNNILGGQLVQALVLIT